MHQIEPVTLALILLGIGLAGGLVSFLTHQRIWLGVAAATNALQLYTLPIGGVYLSTSHLATLAPWRSLPELRRLSGEWWLLAAVALTALQLLSVVWSIDKVQALRQFVYQLPFFLVLAATIRCARSDPRIVERSLRIILTGAVFVALLVIAFRLNPALKVRFLGSPVARLLVSPNQLSELFSSPGVYTTFDPNKSGGPFLNANTAAAYLGLCAILSFYFAPVLKASSLTAGAVVLWCAVLFTGSKAGVMLAVAVPALLVLRGSFRARPTRGLAIVSIAVVAFLAAVAIAGFADRISDTEYVTGSADTLRSRTEIWRFGLSALRDRVWLGLGFGGWELLWRPHALTQGISPFLPPHNAFLALWAQSGVFAAILGAAFAGLLLWRLWQLSLSGDQTTARISLGLFAGFGWVFVQAQGENFGLFSEVHMTPLMALALGYVVAGRAEAPRA